MRETPTVATDLGLRPPKGTRHGLYERVSLRDLSGAEARFR